MSEAMESEALREVRRRREEREAAEEASPSDWELVEEAVEKKEWEVVRWIVRQGTIGDIDKRRGPDEKTLLHEACHDGDLETVMMLCQEMGANVGVYQSGKRWWRAIHWAADGGHIEVIRFLLTEGGAGLESADNRGCHPLHVGAHSLPVVQCLVEEFGAEVDAKNHRRESPLLLAARAGAVSCLRFLVERGASLDAKTGDGEGVLQYAAGAESADGLRYLAEECGCDPSAMGEWHQRKVLLPAVLHNSVECVRYLVEERSVPLEAAGHSAGSLLREAARSDAVAVAEYLVKEGGVSAEDADERYRWRPLHSAAKWGRLRMVQWLVQQCHVDVEAATTEGVRALHSAAAQRGGSLPTLRVLLEDGGADVNAQSDWKKTALHMAAAGGHGDLECIRYLVEEADANVLLEDRHGKRPSQLSTREEVIVYLQEAEEMALMRKNPE